MPDRDDIPEIGRDPMDEAYLHAEQVLDDEDARAARRARILTAVAQEPPAAPSVRRPVRRYGGWLAAACVAGLSVWTAQQVYRSAPPPQPAAPARTPAAVAPSAHPTSSQPTAPLITAQPPAPLRSAVRASGIAPPVTAQSPIAPQPDIAPPPPLPIPPVEKPIQAPPAPIASPSVNAPAPPAPAPPPPAPVTAAKAGAAEPSPNNTVQSVVITGSRIERRDYSASSPAISQPLSDSPQISDARSRMLEARSRALGARLNLDVATGRIADIEPTLIQGAPVDAVDTNGETPLMKAVQTGQSDAAALLRRYGASLDLKNRAGLSARDMAAAKNDPAINRALGLGPQGISPSGAAPP